MEKKINLIGISGKKGSGKNTVASVIQYLIFQSQAKDKWTFEEFWEDVQCHGLYSADEFSGWQQKAFAAKLKQIASILTGIPQEKFEDQNFKKGILSEEWDRWDNEGAKIAYPIREFLQELGTEAMRDNIHGNVWLNALWADYIAKDKPTFHSGNYSGTCKDCGQHFIADKRQSVCKDCCDKSEPIYPNWIITDVRFENEAESIKQRGGIIIRVNRPGLDSSDNHPSETSLDNYEFDYVIDNSSDMNNLIAQVETILKDFKIIN